LLNTVPAGLLYVLLGAGGYTSAGTLITLVAALSLLSLLIWAVHTPYIAESFRTGVRAAGYGISYSLATIIPGLYSFYQLGLSTFMPYAYTAIVLLVIGGVLLAAGALAGPETKDVDFESVELLKDAGAAERELQPTGTDRLLGTAS
jgi:hypothetical protein